MAIYWPTPSFKGRTFKVCVLNRCDFNPASAAPHCGRIKDGKERKLNQILATTTVSRNSSSNTYNGKWTETVKLDHNCRVTKTKHQRWYIKRNHETWKHLSCNHDNQHACRKQKSKEEYKPWKWGATARYYTSHTKAVLPVRKFMPRPSRQSDHTKTSWPW